LLLEIGAETSHCPLEGHPSVSLGGVPLALAGLRHAEGNALLTRLSALGTPIGNRLLESTLSLLRKIRRLSPLNIDGVTSAALRAFQI
jgi:hypothetical protein